MIHIARSLLSVSDQTYFPAEFADRLELLSASTDARQASEELYASEDTAHSEAGSLVSGMPALTEFFNDLHCCYPNHSSRGVSVVHKHTRVAHLAGR